MNIHLTPEMELIVDGKVKAGGYNSANEVVQEALALLQRRDLAREDIRINIDKSIESLRVGEGTEADVFMARMMGDLDDGYLLCLQP